MAADFDETGVSSYKGKQRVNRKGTPLLPPEEVGSISLHMSAYWITKFHRVV